MFVPFRLAFRYEVALVVVAFCSIRCAFGTWLVFFFVLATFKGDFPRFYIFSCVCSRCNLRIGYCGFYSKFQSFVCSGSFIFFNGVRPSRYFQII